MFVLHIQITMESLTAEDALIFVSDPAPIILAVFQIIPLELVFSNVLVILTTMLITLQEGVYTFVRGILSLLPIILLEGVSISVLLPRLQCMEI
jgi:hypothetical protein